MEANSFDTAIIGGGAVGCAMARRFALAGQRVVLLERGADILSGASKGNSAILHTGFDAPCDSLELDCIRAGHAEYRTIHADMNLPLLETGALVVAWTEAEEARLPDIAAKAHANGVTDVALIGRDALRTRVPEIAPTARAALEVRGECVIDPWSPFLAYSLDALGHDGKIWRRSGVSGGAFDGTAWDLETESGHVRAGQVINCAGLFGDRVEAMLLGESHFTIRPRKGQFVVLDKRASQFVSTILLPVPTERTKGIVVTPTAFGNVLVGPTAEDQDDRTRAPVEADTLRTLLERAGAMIPALAAMPVTAAYAGLRPASEESGYRIRHVPERRFTSVGGIRSTGMTSALGLAQHVANLHGLGAEILRRVPPPKVPNLAEDRPRPWQAGGYDEIVCHCELVTRTEIERALCGALPAGDFGGLRRRTRCAMGRCQGFNCMGRLTELTRERLAPGLSIEAVR